MRIAYLTQSYPPMISGASIAAEQLANGLAKHGHEVLVITASDNGLPCNILNKNLSVIRLRSFRNPMRVKQRFLILPYWSIMKTLRDFRPDIIHTHDPLQMGLIGIRYARIARIPILLTSHQLPWFISSYLPDIHILRKTIEKLSWGYARWIARKFTSIISPTKTISTIINTRVGVQPATIHYGIDLRTFTPISQPQEDTEIRTRYNIPKHISIILHVGRLDVDKHVDRVLLSAANVIKRSDAHIMIVGDGSQKFELMALARSLGVELYTHFIGFVSNKKELAKIYRAASAFVTASEIETQGIVLLEAAACGLPIAAVNATCIPEVILEGRTGYMTKPGDITTMSTAIEKLLEISKNMKLECRQMAKKYKIETSLEKHEALYIQSIEYAYKQMEQQELLPAKG